LLFAEKGNFPVLISYPLVIWLPVDPIIQSETAYGRQ